MEFDCVNKAMITTTAKIDDELLSAVEKGLSAEHKNLPSWLFYDAEGDSIFQQIMNLPSYYVTRCEFEILTMHKEDILTYFKPFKDTFDIVELGAGDGTKTEIILSHLYSEGVKFCYRPIDISSDVLNQMSERLKNSYPGIEVQPLSTEYFEALHHLDSRTRKLVLFLGANIGNFSIEESITFLRKLQLELLPQDYALIGFDLKKDPRVIVAAYDDSEDVTKKFNLNVLRRLNDEIGARFEINAFDHYAVYDPQTGSAKSFLISLKDQDVTIGRLKRTFHFAQWETIHTEISQKYDLLMLERTLYTAGLEIVDLFFDEKHWFCDVLVKRK
jgi:L-histidine N-alpha-methyltransferase